MLRTVWGSAAKIWFNSIKSRRTSLVTVRNVLKVFIIVEHWVCHEGISIQTQRRRKLYWHTKLQACIHKWELLSTAIIIGLSSSRSAALQHVNDLFFTSFWIFAQGYTLQFKNIGSKVCLQIKKYTTNVDWKEYVPGDDAVFSNLMRGVDSSD